MTTGDPRRRLANRVKRARVHPPDDVYPVDPWRIVETRFCPEFLCQYETIFSLANGFLGLRGDFEEDAPVVLPGVFLNGFHETWPIVYGESAFGFARTGQTIVNATDGKTIKPFLDDEPFDLRTGRVLECRRVLDMRAGICERDICWENPAGKRYAIRTRRMVSLVHRHLAVVECEVTPLNHPSHVVLVSEAKTRHLDHGADDDPRRTGGFDGRVLIPELQRAHDRRAILGHRTRNSGLGLACGMDHEFRAADASTERSEASGNRAEIVLSEDVAPGDTVGLTKFVAYHFGPEDADELVTRCERTLDRAREIGAEPLFREQAEAYAELWNDADVEIRGDPAAQQIVRFNLFQIIQATARSEGHGIPAKGLTGQGYEGHYFWDGEAYVLPAVIYSAPRTARNLLQFRYAMLDSARERAGQLGHRGALFPWRTIDGEEASAYYEAGTAQYHIDADVMWAMSRYVNATGDTEFLCEAGGEMLVETARFWVDLGVYSERMGGDFCLFGVTGPDEYTAIVDNNRYTNLMARENLRSAARTVESLRERHPTEFERLARRLELDATEPGEWRRAAEAMHLAVDPETGIHPQDDTFLFKPRWDCVGTPPEKYPLLLHFHPLTLYRHQVLKQVDVVMAMFQLRHEFENEEMKRNFDYYDPLTTRDSSLSSCVQSIVASQIGYDDLAMDYFMDAATVDLADIGGNVSDGVHIASAGGVWMALVYGFAGMRDHEGALSFRPRLPARWEGMRFALAFRGRRLEVEIDGSGTTYTLSDGPDLQIRHGDADLRLKAGAETRV